jgi:hypothetical protein
MQYNLLQTITDTLPALIPCAEIVADGFVRDQAVRIVTSDELVESGYRATREKRPPKEVPNWLYLANLKLLLDAGERKDLTAARKAAAAILPYLPISRVRVRGDQAGFLRSLVEHSAHDVIGDGFQLAYWLSGAVMGCELRFFVRSNIRERDDGRVPPAMRNELPVRAMFCPDLARAYAYLLFFDGLAVCPRCQKVFVSRAKKTGKDYGKRTIYCSRPCGDVHRMARYRERKKIEAAKKSAKRHGGRR